jgi:hypothetical protein
MSETNIHMIATVLAFVVILLLTAFLRKRRILNEENAPMFARLLTQVVLPVVIFFRFLRYPPVARHLLPVLALFVGECCALLAAWMAARLLRLSRPATGALMIVSAFGSSALLGYPLVEQTFAHNPSAMAEAILISELAVGLPIFTLCPLVAMNFGEASKTAGSPRDTLLQYFRSPIFIALVLGIAVSQLHIPPESPYLAPILEAAKMIDGTLACLGCLILGMQMRVISPRRILPFVIISAVLQMGLQPLLAYGQAVLYHLGGLDRRVLVLVAAMPSAVLGPVFAVRYKCEGELASTATFLNILVGSAGVPAVFWLLGR